MTPISELTTDELWEICNRIGNDKAPGKRSKALELAVNSRADMLAELFEMSIFEGIFPVPWKPQKLVLLPKAGKPPSEPFYR